MKAELNIANSKIKTIDNNVTTLKEDLGTVKENQDNMKDKFDTMAHDNTGTFELFKATTRKRVWNLVGNQAGSVRHILFQAPFMSKIYSDIYNHFGASNSGAIRMEDSNTAIQMAKSWKPSRKYIDDKINEYIRMRETDEKYMDKIKSKNRKRLLSETRSKALDNFMIETNGGTNVGRYLFKLKGEIR